MTVAPICLPPAPVNGGRLEHAPDKVGVCVWQPKPDDWRAVLHVPSGRLWNQYGKQSSIRTKFDKAILFIQERTRIDWLDVGLMNNRHDLMRGCIIIFDAIPDFDKEMGLLRRYGLLKHTFPTLPMDVADLLGRTGGQVRDSVYLINQWENVSCHQDAMQRQAWLQIQNEAIGHKFFEGLVAKRALSPYPFNQRSKVETGDWIKHRFDQ